MQHEMMRLPTPNIASDNIGDVLASIRQLIAQDAAGCRIANAALNAVPATAVGQGPAANVPDFPPLVLACNDLVAPAPAPCAVTGPHLPASPLAAVDSADSAPAQQPVAAPCPEIVPMDAQPATQDPSADAIPDTAPLITFPQMEETMLHANASVTPITPALDAQVATDAVGRDSAGTHLFAPEDKAAQKGNHLRGMIREAIRQELQGEIGTRLSRNLQAMIRQEVELTLRQMCEQE